MSQTNRIKLISRNWESQRLCDPFNSHPCCPLNAAAPSFLFFFLKLYNRAPFYFLFKNSCLFNRPACANVHAGDNKFMSCSQNDWKVVMVPTRKTPEWIFSCCCCIVSPFSASRHDCGSLWLLCSCSTCDCLSPTPPNPPRSPSHHMQALHAKLSLDALLQMTGAQVRDTMRRLGSSSEECARLIAALSCLKSAAESGTSTLTWHL